MKPTLFRASLFIPAIAIVIACSPGGSIVPAGAEHRTVNALPVQGGGGGDGGSTPTPAPTPTPDAAAEDACNSAGGTFYQAVGGSGSTCAGQNSGPPAVTIYNAPCGYTINMTKGNGTISKGGSLLGSFQKGIEVYQNDCSYIMYS